ncbi:MAG: tetratricopeptide repeat protein [Candidatus Saccharimonadaceae bacterium]
MERTKYTLIILIMTLSIQSLNAQYKMAIYDAYISNKMDSWKSIIDKMQDEPIKTNQSLLELVNYQYGYIGWCIGNNEKKQAKTYLKLAEDNLATLEKKAFNPSYINAYKSAFYGFSIGLNKLKAPFNGPKSVDAAKRAMQDASNPFGFIQYGNAQFYMPPVFGGSKTEAISYFKKAQGIMEKDSQYLNKNWNYLSLLVIMAEAYTEMKEYDKADEYYKQILTIAPKFQWVKNELYPNFKKKKNNE